MFLELLLMSRSFRSFAALGPEGSLIKGPIGLEGLEGLRLRVSLGKGKTSC